MMMMMMMLIIERIISDIFHIIGGTSNKGILIIIDFICGAYGTSPTAKQEYQKGSNISAKLCRKMKNCQYLLLYLHFNLEQ